MQCGGVAKEHLKERTIVVNHPSKPTSTSRKRRCENRIISSHYTWWNFVFLNWFEQVHNLATFFFIGIAVLYFYGETPLSPLVTIGPLVFVVAISMLKDGIDDIKRHKSDRKANNLTFDVWTQSKVGKEPEWNKIKSEAIYTGDIVLCREDDAFPCDLIILSSSDTNGTVYITTGNLDGETSVKTMHSLPATQSPFQSLISSKPDSFTKMTFLPANLICQSPNGDLHAFEGRFEFSGSSCALGLENLAMRGAILRQTNFIIGIAVYTGHDTKLSLNAKCGKRKTSTTAGRFNAIMLGFMITLFLLTLVFTIAQFVWRATPVGSGWYLNYRPISAWKVVQEAFNLTFLLNYLIPISIMLTLDVLDIFLALYISKDIKLYDEANNIKSEVNATSLAYELGQIEFLFSDKTGTLTQNKMQFRAFALPGDPNTYILRESGLYALKYDTQFWNQFNDQVEKCTCSSDKPNEYFSSSSEEENFCDSFDNFELKRYLSPRLSPSKVNVLSEKTLTFCTAAALCHTVEVRSNSGEWCENPPSYCAASPDEKALVEASAQCGVIYLGRDVHQLSSADERNFHAVGFRNLNTMSSNSSDPGWSVKRFKRDAIIDFDSERKRMTVFMRQKDGRCVIFTKGAEIVMLNPKLCGQTPPEMRDDAMKRVTDFASAGLRTLVYAMREVQPEEYLKLLAELDRAQGLVGKKRLLELEGVYAKIECKMSLIGVTAVEDKLQPGVKRCLRSLRAAGIQVWVLTGDKEETAVQVSRSAGHFPPGLTLIRLTDGCSIEDVARRIYEQNEGMKLRLGMKTRRRLSRWQLSANSTTLSPGKILEKEGFEEKNIGEMAVGIAGVWGRLQRVQKRLTSGRLSLRRRRRKHPGAAGESVGLVIDSQTLGYAISPILCRDFLRLCMNVTTVLCCRLTPLQKAAVVKLVSGGLEDVDGLGAPMEATMSPCSSRPMWASASLATRAGRPKYAPIFCSFISRLCVYVCVVLSFTFVYSHNFALYADYLNYLGAKWTFFIKFLVNYVFGIIGRNYVHTKLCNDSERYLRRLLLVHGQWNYYRVSTAALLFYFKCVAFVAVHAILLFFNGFSAQSMVEGLLYTLYNLTLTSWGPFCLALFEQHILEKELLRRPYLYRLVSTCKDSHICTCFCTGPCMPSPDRSVD
ncbi:unnamed protein product [Schistocephalus solidus]|uniref:Phospholipid-transporting ATPase n=1 Tax=Schistocephalus solidus TaxID=70667 RepID=A0A183TJR2_SCHSO|nr:unnamed protein product [Schistocephalus solidus]